MLDRAVKQPGVGSLTPDTDALKAVQERLVDIEVGVHAAKRTVLETWYDASEEDDAVEAKLNVW